ncbi:MAG: amidohydrolase [Candidatus Hydrothermales bacterium]
MKDLDILLKNPLIIQNKEKFIDKGFLGIKNGLITLVSEKEPNLNAKEIVDLSNKIVSPGFFNTHTHIPMTLLRGFADDLPLMEWLTKYIWPLESKLLSPEYVKAGTYIGLIEMIKSGTIGFADMYFFEEEVAEIVEETQIYALLSVGILDFETPYYKNSKEAIKKTEKLIEKYIKNERIKVIPGPHAIYSCSKETIIECVNLAKKYNLPIHTHISETKGELEEAIKKFGKTPVFYLKDLGLFDLKVIAAHCVYLTEDEMNLLKDKEFYVSHNISSNLKLASGIAPIKKYIEKGLKITIGTDSASSNNNLDILREMKLVSLIHKGINLDPLILSAREVFNMATKMGALALGFESGELLEGKPADLVIFNPQKEGTIPFYDPYSYIVYAAGKESIESVMVNGKWIMKNGEFKTIDTEKIFEETFYWKNKIKNLFT